MVVISRNYPCNKIQTPSGTVVSYIFGRTKVGDEKNDGNPLIFALKGLNEYTIQENDVNVMWSAASDIIKASFSAREFDCIVPVASAYNVVSDLCNLVVQNIGSVPVHHIIKKITVGAALDSLPEMTRVRKVDRDLLEDVVRNMRRAKRNAPFSLKHVHSRVRQYFSTLSVSLDAKIPHQQKILIVDDLVSSGTSFRDAGRLLAVFKPSHLSGLSLLGPLDTRSTPRGRGA